MSLGQLSLSDTAGSSDSPVVKHLDNGTEKDPTPSGVEMNPSSSSSASPNQREAVNASSSGSSRSNKPNRKKSLVRNLYPTRQMKSSARTLQTATQILKGMDEWREYVKCIDLNYSDFVKLFGKWLNECDRVDIQATLDKINSKPINLEIEKALEGMWLHNMLYY
eukprot:Awhi_evm1s755